MTRPQPTTPPRRASGVALLMVVTAIAILSLVVVEFSGSARIHLNQGINIRDEVRALTAADTALVLTRACLDPAAWGPMAMFQAKLDLERLCNLLLGIFIGGRVDLPLGGLSVELEGIEGVGIAKAEVEQVKLTPEDSFVGLAGLHCPRGQLNCGSRRTTARQLRSLLCDPRLADIFQSEQADGNRYTVDEIIGNMIDWVDADDNRITLDVASGQFVQGAGENEDAYYKRDDDHYRVKDAPFDSIEELRMVRGMSDELFDFLKDKVSVHATGKLNVNTAGAEIMGSLLRAHSEGFDKITDNVCGQDNSVTHMMESLFSRYGQMIVQARKLKQMQVSHLLAKPFKKARVFVKLARDPLKYIRQYTETNPLLGQTVGLDDDQLLLRFGLNRQMYDIVRNTVNWKGLQRSVKTKTNLFRLVAVGRVGNMSRRVFAVLKREGKVVRTLYYREE